MLFRAAAELGPISGDADGYTMEVFGRYVDRVGVVFQIRDGVLDVTADADLGMPAGMTRSWSALPRRSDGSGRRRATRSARQEVDAALATLGAAEVADSEATWYLEDWAEFVVLRDR